MSNRSAVSFEVCMLSDVIKGTSKGYNVVKISYIRKIRRELKVGFHFLHKKQIPPKKRN